MLHFKILAAKPGQSQYVLKRKVERGKEQGRTGRLQPNQQNAIKWIAAASVTNVLAAQRELC